MEAFQRPTIRIGSPQAAPISFGQFGNPLPQGFQNIGGLGMPQLPLSPVELSFLRPLGGGHFDGPLHDSSGELLKL